jgi:hypothetical protein
MTYTSDIDNYISKIELIQEANTVDGGEFEELDITIHQLPIGKKIKVQEDDFFIVLKTNQWAIDYRDIDKFAEYLKQQIKLKIIK